MTPLFRLIVVLAGPSLILATAATPAGIAAVRGPESNRPALDKTWTRGCKNGNGSLQVPDISSLTNRRSFAAERAGFEPAVRFDPHTAFPVPHLRPLGHLSETPPPFTY